MLPRSYVGFLLRAQLRYLPHAHARARSSPRTAAAETALAAVPATALSI